MTTAMTAASYLLTKSLSGDMQLQKLLYYSQAWHLAWTGRPLFDDTIEAWQKGPVVRCVWIDNKRGHIQPDKDASGLSDYETAVINAVYETYGQHGGAALSAFTHVESPWIEAREGLDENAPSRRPISRKTILKCMTRKSIHGDKLTPKAPAPRRDADHGERFAAAAERQGTKWAETFAELRLR